MLALPPSDPVLYEECKNGVVVLGTMTIPGLLKKSSSEKKKKTKKKGKGKNESSDESDYDDAEEQKIMKDKFHDEWEKKRKGRSSKEHQTNTLLMDDFYHILGLEDLGIAATEKHIKTAYRKLALEYHPDKGNNNTGTKGNDDDQEMNPEEKVKKEIWLKIQKAYETLMDPEKRRKHDSSLPFDESVPAETEITPENFYDLFETVFNRNAQWAKKKPVPQLGNDKTPIKKVLKFYKFWDSFETWRDFSCHDEYDVEEAQDRYERKYMQNENAKIRSKYIKTERGRLNELYRIAYRNDPRIKRHNEEEEKEKELKKKEKFDKKQKAREEKSRKENETRFRMEEEKRKLEEAKQRERLKVQLEGQMRENMIAKFKEIADAKLKPFNYEYDQYFVEEFVKKQTDGDIKIIIDAIEVMKDDEEGFEEIKELIKTKEEESIQRIRGGTIKDKAKIEENKTKTKNWNKEDYALLAKSLNKFPGGTPDRWKTIANYMGTEYTSKDVIDMAKQLTDKMNNGKGASNGEPEAIIRSNGATIEEFKKNEEAIDDDWSKEDQKLLEVALKKNPKNLPPKERWNCISKAVPGKTPKECLARFKHIREIIKKKGTK